MVKQSKEMQVCPDTTCVFSDNSMCFLATSVWFKHDPVPGAVVLVVVLELAVNSPVAGM